MNLNIVSALSLQLADNESSESKRRGTAVMEAYDYVLRGMKESQASTMEGSARARYCFERALELDSGYSTAYARLAFNYIFRWIMGWSRTRADSIDRGFELATKAVALDDQLALSHAVLCWAHLWRGEHDKALDEGRRAIALDPGDAVALERLALTTIFAGDAASSLPLIDRARRVNPKQTYSFAKGVALFTMRDYEGAIELLRADFDQNPNFIPSGLYLASSAAHAGHAREAAGAAAGIRAANPDFALSTDFRSHFRKPEDREHFVDGLRKAGFT